MTAAPHPRGSGRALVCSAALAAVTLLLGGAVAPTPVAAAPKPLPPSDMAAVTSSPETTAATPETADAEPLAASTSEPLAAGTALPFDLPATSVLRSSPH